MKEARMSMREYENCIVHIPDYKPFRWKGHPVVSVLPDYETNEMVISYEDDINDP